MNTHPLSNEVIDSYSEHASDYDQLGNLRSCWGEVADQALRKIQLKEQYRTIVDVGCGTGQALRTLLDQADLQTRFIGIEPAENMRNRAADLLRPNDQVEIMDGRFEKIPIDKDCVDYLYSILAFHWTTSLEASVAELARVLSPNGDMDLFFTGRHTGREFTTKTTPIFLKYMGAARLLQAAAARKHLTLETANKLFQSHFPTDNLQLEESFQTYYDDLEGHWNWWIPRVAGHFLNIPEEIRTDCNREVREAIASLTEDQGIPYTVHLLHVRIRN